MGRNNKSFSITEISINDSNIVNPNMIEEYLNDYFVNIGLLRQKKIKNWH